MMTMANIKSQEKSCAVALTAVVATSLTFWLYRKASKPSARKEPSKDECETKEEEEEIEVDNMISAKPTTNENNISSGSYAPNNEATKTVFPTPDDEKQPEVVETNMMENPKLSSERCPPSAAPDKVSSAKAVQPTPRVIFAKTCVPMNPKTPKVAVSRNPKTPVIRTVAFPNKTPSSRLPLSPLTPNSNMKPLMSSSKMSSIPVKSSTKNKTTRRPRVRDSLLPDHIRQTVMAAQKTELQLLSTTTDENYRPTTNIITTSSNIHNVTDRKKKSTTTATTKKVSKKKTVRPRVRDSLLPARIRENVLQNRQDHAAIASNKQQVPLVPVVEENNPTTTPVRAVTTSRRRRPKKLSPRKLAIFDH